MSLFQAFVRWMSALLCRVEDNLRKAGQLYTRGLSFTLTLSSHSNPLSGQRSNIWASSLLSRAQTQQCGSFSDDVSSRRMMKKGHWACNHSILCIAYVFADRNLPFVSPENLSKSIHIKTESPCGYTWVFLKLSSL